jgi:hypothetical protein
VLAPFLQHLPVVGDLVLAFLGWDEIVRIDVLQSDEHPADGPKCLMFAGTAKGKAEQFASVKPNRAMLIFERPFRWRPTTKKTSTRPETCLTRDADSAVQP